MRIKTFVLTGLGFSFLGLGAVGLFIPVWPTTPFVLASFACFSSSPHMRSRIMTIPIFREYIQNYSSGNGLSIKTILLSLFWLWGMLILSILVIQEVKMTILLIFIGLSVTIHILWISRTKKRKDE